MRHCNDCAAISHENIPNLSSSIKFHNGANMCVASKYYYPGYYIGWDIAIDCLYVIVEGTRLLLASKANKASNVYSMIWSLVLGCPILVAHSYFIALQTYVLRIDVVINAIAFFLVGMEMLMSLLTLSQIFLASRKF